MRLHSPAITGSLTLSGSAVSTGNLTFGGNAVVGNTSGDSSITIKASNSTNSILYFGDVGNATVAGIDYDHNDNSMDFNTANTTALTLDSSQNVTLGGNISGSITSTGSFGMVHGANEIRVNPTKTINTTVDNSYWAMYGG